MKDGIILLVIIIIGVIAAKIKASEDKENKNDENNYISENDNEVIHEDAALKIQNEINQKSVDRSISTHEAMEKVVFDAKKPNFTKHFARKCFDDFVAFDFETTGLNKEMSHIIEVSAARFKKGEICDTFTTLINPERPIPTSASSINNITDDMVKDAPIEKDAILSFIEWLGSDVMDGKVVLVAHNASFDIGFFRAALARLGIDATIIYQDTLALSRRFQPYANNHKLGTMCRHYKIKVDNAHRAESDAICCGKLFVKFIYESGYLE